MKMDEVYVALVNIDSEFLFSKSFTMFVEIRAELYAWEEGEPKFTVEFNNLSALVAQNINWTPFLENEIDKLVTTEFKNRKDATADIGS